MRFTALTLPLLLGLAACADPATAPAQTPEQPAEAPAPTAEQPAPTPQPATPASPASEPSAADGGSQIPARFQGRYASTAAACAQQGDESQLQLLAQRVVFHESSGSVTAVQTNGDAIAITAQLTGEGETWERTSRFRLEEGDSALADVEHGMRRVRCHAD